MRYGSSFTCTGLIALSALALHACGFESRDIEQTEHPAAGLFTPESKLGASDPTDLPMKANLGNRCAALPPATGTVTNGSLAVEYTTQTLMGRYAPKNVSAVWIETPDGKFVATLEISANIRRPALWYFQDHACIRDSTDPTMKDPDVITSPTQKDHEKVHKVRWSGVDFLMKPAADGPYKLFIEVTETDDPGVFATFDFMKGPAEYEMELPVSAEGALKAVSIGWKLAPEGSAGAGFGL